MAKQALLTDEFRKSVVASPTLATAPPERPTILPLDAETATTHQYNLHDYWYTAEAWEAITWILYNERRVRPRRS